MAKKETNRRINRELSWLEFNQRVLDQARDSSAPLLERLRFLGITASNLDEFFMVRVGGLQMMLAQGLAKRDPAGFTPAEQLTAIGDRVLRMVGDQYACYDNELEPALSATGVCRIRPHEFTDEQRRHALHVFENEILPVLTPIAVPDTSTLPLLANRAMHVGVRMSGDPGGRFRFAVIPLAKAIGRLVALPAESGHSFALVEDIVKMSVGRFFEGEGVVECVPFRITRNADLSVREDLAGDILSEMEAVLDARKRSDCVRLEIAADASAAMLTFLQKALRLAKSAVFRVSGPLELSAFSALCDLKGFASLRYDPWPAQASPLFTPGKKLVDTLAAGPVLLYHPFETFEPVVRLIEEAADDPDVVAIKQVLYRTSRSSPIVAGLMRAAQRGKYVTALVELKARFDEMRNIEWAQELEDAGVQVVYGVKGLKTHAKVLLIVRRESSGLRRYVHFGTGNYNEINATIYCDVSYFTADEDLGSDATAFFNAVTGYSQPIGFRTITMAPISLRERVVELIRGEMDRSKQGQAAFVRAKLNSLSDPDMVDLLYEASCAGVKIALNVRGVCCLRPGVKGLSENITVTSIVDRFLEHARIIHVCNGGKNRVFISTADWMLRNLDRRVEVLVPIDDAASRESLIEVLDVCFADTANAWRLLPSGSYERLRAASKKRVRSQEVLYSRACDALKHARRMRRTTFEVYRPSK